MNGFDDPFQARSAVHLVQTYSPLLWYILIWYGMESIAYSIEYGIL